MTQAAEYYTNDGKKDAFVNLIPQMSVRMMMRALIDFIEEETLLQYHGKTLGVIVDRTPKCHPKVAGEGIEYSWGCLKGKYSRLLLSAKRRKDNFQNSVCQCLELTVEIQIMFNKRARQYMLAYQYIEISKDRSKSEATEEMNSDVEKTRTLKSSWKCRRTL
jgi:hypothetical protein